MNLKDESGLPNLHSNRIVPEVIHLQCFFGVLLYIARLYLLFTKVCLDTATIAFYNLKIFKTKEAVVVKTFKRLHQFN